MYTIYNQPSDHDRIQHFLVIDRVGDPDRDRGVFNMTPQSLHVEIVSSMAATTDLEAGLNLGTNGVRLNGRLGQQPQDVISSFILYPGSLLILSHQRRGCLPSRISVSRAATVSIMSADVRVGIIIIQNADLSSP